MCVYFAVRETGEQKEKLNGEVILLQPTVRITKSYE